MNAASKPSAAHVAALAGVQYACGLTWRILPGLPDTTPTAEAREVAARAGLANGVVVQSGTRHIVGLAVGRTVRGAHAAAGIAAAIPTRRLLLVRLTPELIWLCHVEDSGLNLDADLVLDRTRALQMVQSICTAASAKSKPLPIICSPDIDLDSPWLDGAERAPLSQILPATSDSRIRKLDTMSPRARVYLALAIIIPTALGYHQWQSYHARQEASRLELQAAAAGRQQTLDLATATALREAAIAKAVLDALAADSAFPSAAESLAICKTQTRSLGRYIGGYKVRDVRCEPLSGLVTANLSVDHPSSPTFGTPARLTAAAAAADANVSIGTTLRDATWTHRFTPPAPREPLSRVDQLPMLSEVLASATPMLSRTRGTRTFNFLISQPAPRAIRLSDPTSITADGTPAEIDVPPDQTWAEGTIRIDAELLDSRVIEAIAARNVRAVSLEYLPERATSTFHMTYLVRP